MKKKLTAVLLTLCMVLGMLPMTAFAGWRVKESATSDVEFSTDKVGGLGYTFEHTDGTIYYVLDKADGTAPGQKLDYFEYYSVTGKLKDERAGQLTWVVDSVSSAVNFTQPAKGGAFTVSVDGTPIESGAKVTEKKTVTINLSPNKGYAVETVTVTGATVEGEGNTRTFTMPAQAVTITVTFKAISYTLTWEQPAKGGTFTVSVNGHEVEKGIGETVEDTITVTATPDTSDADTTYTLGAVVVTPTDPNAANVDPVTVNGTGNVRTFTMPAYNATITVTFAATQVEKKAADPTTGEADFGDVKIEEETDAVVFEVTGVEKTAEKVEAKMPVDAFLIADSDELNDVELETKHVDIKTPKGDLVLQGSTLKALGKKLPENTTGVALKIEIPKPEKIPSSKKPSSVTATAKAVEIDLVALLKDGSEKPIAKDNKSVPGMKVSAYFGVTLGGNAFALWWAPDDDTDWVDLTTDPEYNVKYDEDSGMAEWVTSHFSFLIGDTKAAEETDTPTGEGNTMEPTNAEDPTETALGLGFTFTVQGGQYAVTQVRKDGVYAPGYFKVPGTSETTFTAVLPEGAEDLEVWILESEPAYNGETGGMGGIVSLGHWDYLAAQSSAS